MNASSIKFQLNIQFALLALLALFVATAIFTWQLRHLDNVVQEVSLGHQVDDLVASISVTDDGSLQLDMTPELVRLYEQGHSGSLFLIRNAVGNVLFHDGDDVLEILDDAPKFPATFDFFPVADMSEDEARGLDPRRFGLTRRVETQAGTIFITVAQHGVVDDFLNIAVARELTDDALLVGVPLLSIFLLAAAGFVRFSTRGLTSLSNEARAIGPQNIRARLPVHVAPTEVVPLALAFNDAMDRVAEGFDHQRRFTIDAAHQLKTPLAVLRARLESLSAFDGREALSNDLDHMDRLVRQLLTSARLSVVSIDPNETIDLASLATDAVVALAPIALENGKTLELEHANARIVVPGESHLAIEALLNVVENAVAHTATGSAVTINLREPATIDVMDRGPGVPWSDRKHILMPFAQGRYATPGGSGMGLAIVTRIMALHGGTVSITDREGGGAIFSLTFPTQNTADDS